MTCPEDAAGRCPHARMPAGVFEALPVDNDSSLSASLPARPKMAGRSAEIIAQLRAVHRLSLA